MLCVAMLFTLMACSQTSQTQEAATEPAQEQTETAAATEEPAAEEATEEATEPEYVFKYAHTGRPPASSRTARLRSESTLKSIRTAASCRKRIPPASSRKSRLLWKA